MVDQCFDTLFDDAPVMMDSIDEHWRLVRVNRMWLQTLGYDSQEVLGKRCVDFLTEESRMCAVTDILPLFWQTGSSRSVGLEMVRKDGLVMNVLMDAELDTDEAGVRRSFTSIRGNHDQVPWGHSSTMLTTLTGLVRLRRAMETLLTPVESQEDPSLPRVSDGALPGQDRVLDLLVMARDVSTALRSLGSALAGLAGTVGERERNLVDLAEAVTAFRGKLPWLTEIQPPTRLSQGA